MCFLLIGSNAIGEASNFGTTGLIDIPTAFMANDATLTTTLSFSDQYDYYNLTYQALPWVEATFRYRKVIDIEDTSWSDYYDRNFAAKIRLLEETYYTPQVSFGMRDFVGTGIVGSEYLVASKHWNNFSFTLGLGWGDMAGDDDLKNPFIYLSDKFRTREDGAAGGNEAGEIPTGSAFQGETVGIFGGISYQLERLPLTLLLERNPEYNRYDVNRFGVDKPQSDLSVGLQWNISPNMDLAISTRQGSDWSLRFAYQADTSKKTPRRSYRYVDYSLLNSQASEGTTNWYVALLRDMENSNLLLLDGTLNGTEETAYLRVGNQSYPRWQDAIELSTALAELHLPQKVKKIEFTVEDRGYATINVKVDRPSVQVAVEDLGELPVQAELDEANIFTVPDYATNFVQSTIAFDIGLSTRVQLFDPDEPFRYGIGVAASTAIPLPGDFVLYGSYNHLLEQNFDESRRESNSVLPHVRTDIVEYLNDTDRLNRLYIDKRTTLKNNVSMRAFAGILEEMYMGVGAEFLYHEFNSRLGFGTSLAWVKRRSPESDFGTLDYEAITGFASIYWATPFYNYDIALHLGQYLAEDTGGTLEITRTFGNGWRVGAWATLTDVSSEDFGEGSFDKGIFLNIPLHELLNKNTRRRSQIRIRPIQRDGGQTLEGFSGEIWKDINQRL